MTSDLAVPVVETLATEIIDARNQRLKLKIREQQKKEYMYLSDIHSCDRYNFYSMAEGDKRKPFDEHVVAILESGNIWEREIIKELMTLGFDFIEGQLPIEIKNRKGEVIARGRIDGNFRYRGARIPVEIKSLGQHTYDRINSVEDLFKSDYTEKYIRQLLMYIYGENLESGLFILNDRSGHWKVLVVYLGNWIDYAERTLQRIERAFEAKKAGLAPNRIAYNHRLCGSCQFESICLPTTVIEGGVTLNDPEIEAMLVRHEELKPAAKEYDEIHDSVRALFSDKPATTVGSRFIVTPKKTERRSYDYRSLAAGLSAERMKEIEKVTVSWSIRIEDISKAPTEREGA